MTPQQFIAKWQKVQLSERSACQQHFLDLCELLGQPKPADADPEGAWYTFERGVRKSEGGRGWADVWMKNHFGWEYKGKHKNLEAAYNQLQLYRESLENPPLLVVCDLDRFEIHTNFTGTVKQVHAFDLSGLANPANLDTLRKLFADPQALKPGVTTAAITEDAAARFARISDGMRSRGIAAPDAAHFLMKLIFCMFAEDINLLPEHVFEKALKGARSDPKRLSQLLQALFQAMAEGGFFGAAEIAHFNGGLFADSQVIELTSEEIGELVRAAEYDWSQVEPSIFGTLFERTLDPAKRSQIGAHYTSRADIETLLEPVMMAPLRREWAAVQEQCEALLPKLKTKASAPVRRKESPARREFNRGIQDFVERLAHVMVLDPACGSGNFLYVAIHLLLDLEKEVIAYAARHGLPLIPQVRPTQLAGIEINPYAQQLAQVVIWIGYLQWMHHNGFIPPSNPVLEPIESIRNMDAILDLSDPEHPKEPEWPEADFIVGNPPFVGYSRLRNALGHTYTERLFETYRDRIPNQSDICCYWFEKARAAIATKRVWRSGLLATQGIRGGKNREVLKRIKESGDIFYAVSDRNWVLDGATVHISMIGFDDGTEKERYCDSTRVSTINSNLTSAADITTARPLLENEGKAFIGGFKFGSFDIDDATACHLLNEPCLDGRVSSSVVRPWINGLDVLRRSRSIWIIDFDVLPLSEASLYEAAMALVVKRVKPQRDTMRRQGRRERWWIHGEAAPNLREAVQNLHRFAVTPRVSKHRVWAWVESCILIDGQCVAVATADDYVFGLLHSRIHEIWTRSQGTQVREAESDFRYTPTTCFETFPFPEPTDAQREVIAEAARELDRLRSNWLNPPEWTREEVLEFPGSVDGPWARYVHNADARGIGTVRYPRLVPKDEACAAKLKKRTLTNLYNERPTWLDLAHKRLDEAVFAAYGWNADLSDEDLLAALLELNLARA